MDQDKWPEITVDKFDVDGILKFVRMAKRGGHYRGNEPLLLLTEEIDRLKGMLALEREKNALLSAKKQPSSFELKPHDIVVQIIRNDSQAVTSVWVYSIGASFETLVPGMYRGTLVYSSLQFEEMDQPIFEKFHMEDTSFIIRNGNKIVFEDGRPVS